MTAYNKLKIAILAIIASQNIQAITIDPIQIQSAPGELLYAEMNFRQADPDTQIQASLASAEDIMSLGIVHQPPGHLNFFTRRDSTGNGVITITSSRPLTEAELNIIVKIKQGNTTRLQHIQTSLMRSNNSLTQARMLSNEKALAPIMISNEKEIALQLPESTQYQVKALPAATSNSFEAPLMTNKAAPPRLNVASSTAMMVSSMTMPTAIISVNDVPAADTGHPAESTTEKAMTTKLANKPAQQATAAVKAPMPTPANKSASTSQITQHVVQANESLWTIASRLATEQNRPISQVMKQIKANNKHAFIQDDMNRLRRGVALNLNSVSNLKEPQNMTALNATKSSPNQSGKAKYRLNQAEMSLVAEKEQDSASGSATKNTEKKQTSNELSLKVMTSREKTVKLQRNVTQLEVALSQKDHRIQLLNTRLARLQQQLKAQQVQKKPIH